MNLATRRGIHVVCPTFTIRTIHTIKKQPFDTQSAAFVAAAKSIPSIPKSTGLPEVRRVSLVKLADMLTSIDYSDRLAG